MPFEGLAMAFTMQDFTYGYIKRELPLLSKEDLAYVLADMPLEILLASVSKEQLRMYLEEMDPKPTKSMNKPKRKKK